MFRTLSRKLSFRGNAEERDFNAREVSPKTSPEFKSADAVRHDRARASASRESHSHGMAGPSYAHQTSLGNDAMAPSLRPFSFESRSDDAFYMGSALEALALETIIQPTLGRMRERTAHAADLAFPEPPTRAEVRAWIQAPPQVHSPNARQGRFAVERDTVLVRSPIPGITVTPPAQDAKEAEDSPRARERNVFEQEFGEPQALVKAHKKKDPFHLEEELQDKVLDITPLPRRPLLRRNALSYRTQRELPLRVQATRRAHQAAFAATLNQRSHYNFAVERRGSLPDIAIRARQEPSSRPTLRRQHSSSLGADAFNERPRVTLPQPGPRPTAPLPDLPRTASRGRPRTQERDHYLEAAMASWEFNPRSPSPLP